MAAYIDTQSQPIPIPSAKRKNRFCNGSGWFRRPISVSSPSTGVSGFGAYVIGNAQHPWIPVQAPYVTNPRRNWSVTTTASPPITYEGPRLGIATVPFSSSPPVATTPPLAYFTSTPLMSNGNQVYSPVSSLSSGYSLSPVEQDYFGMNENINQGNFYCGNGQVPPSDAQAISYRNEGFANYQELFNGSSTTSMGSTCTTLIPVGSTCSFTPQESRPVEGYVEVMMMLPYRNENSPAPVYQRNLTMEVATSAKAKRNFNQKKTTSKILCTFCKSNKETRKFYETHELKKDGVVSCPILRRYVCPVCQATGDNAHTLKYCPENLGEKAIRGAIMECIGTFGTRNSRGIKGHYKSY